MMDCVVLPVIEEMHALLMMQAESHTPKHNIYA